MISFGGFGQPVAYVRSGKYKGEVVSIVRDEKDVDPDKDSQEMDLGKGELDPILNTDERQNCYIAGPSGSGKSTYAAKLIKGFRKVFKKNRVYIFSRTDVNDDPAYKKIKPIQIAIDKNLIEDPIKIEEIEPGSLIIFDDCNTIPDEKVKKAITVLMCDIMEVGRKLRLWIIITNHLVNPNEKALGRTIMNEMQTFTFFPKSGSATQIEYCLGKYFGLKKDKIQKIMELPSRWITILKNYPQCVLYEHGAYLL